MNLVTLQERLKDFSEQQLVSEMQMPSGQVPQFLLLTELNRRKRMADQHQLDMAQGDQQTVAQDLLATAGLPAAQAGQMAGAMAPQTDMMGNTAATQAPQPQAPQQRAPMPGGPGGPIMMREGGIVALQEGGQIRRPLPFAVLPGDELGYEELYQLSRNQRAQLGLPVSQAGMRMVTARGPVVVGGLPQDAPVQGPTHAESLLATQGIPGLRVDSEQDSAPRGGRARGGGGLPFALPEFLSRPGAVAQALRGERPLLGDGEGGSEPRRPRGRGDGRSQPSADPAAAEDVVEPIPDAQDERESAEPPADPTGPTSPTGPAGPGGGGAGGAAAPGSFEEFLQQRMESAEADRRRDQWLALAQFGLQLMASERPTLGGAIGEAGAQAIESLRGSYQDYNNTMMELYGTREQLAMNRARLAGRGGAAGARPPSLSQLSGYYNNLVQRTREEAGAAAEAARRDPGNNQLQLNAQIAQREYETALQTFRSLGPLVGIGGIGGDDASDIPYLGD